MKSLQDKVKNIVMVYNGSELLQVDENKNTIHFIATNGGMKYKVSKKSGIISMFNNASQKWFKLQTVNI